MTPNSNILEQNVIDFIHGKKSWDILEPVGITVSFTNDTAHISEKEIVTVNPDISDIIKGLLKYQEQPSELRKWATIVTGITTIDFKLLQDSKEGQELIEILWDLSGGEKLDKKAFEFIDDLQQSIKLKS
jgi:hypothetical protein